MVAGPPCTWTRSSTPVNRTISSNRALGSIATKASNMTDGSIGTISSIRSKGSSGNGQRGLIALVPLVAARIVMPEVRSIRTISTKRTLDGIGTKSSRRPEKYRNFHFCSCRRRKHRDPRLLGEAGGPGIRCRRHARAQKIFAAVFGVVAGVRLLKPHGIRRPWHGQRATVREGREASVLKELMGVTEVFLPMLEILLLVPRGGWRRSADADARSRDRPGSMSSNTSISSRESRELTLPLLPVQPSSRWGSRRTIGSNRTIIGGDRRCGARFRGIQAFLARVGQARISVAVRDGGRWFH